MGTTVSRCLGILPYSAVISSGSSDITVDEMERMMEDVAEELANIEGENPTPLERDCHEV